MGVYYETIHVIERLHRQSLDVLKLELDRLGLEDINNVQGLILYNIGTDQLTVGELTLRGYYLGSNVSYNLKKMVEAGYLIQERSLHDKRSVRVRVSQKGIALCEKFDMLFERHVQMLARAGFSKDDMIRLGDVLGKLERFWAVQCEPHMLTLNAA